MGIRSVELPQSRESKQIVSSKHIPQDGAFLDSQAARPFGSLRAIRSLALLFLLTLFTSLFLLVTLPGWRDAHEVYTKGQIVEAQVESHRVDKDREGNSTYYVTYGFRAPETGSYHLREQQVSRDTFEGLAVEAPINVRYLPSDADRSTLEADRTELTARTITAGLNAVAAIAVLIGLIVIMKRPHRRNTQVWREPVALRVYLSGRFTPP